MSDIDGGPRLESDSRRPGWTCGTPVRLGDGSWWTLPRVELADLITSAGLRDDLARALELARDAQGEPEGSRSEILRHMKYHMHMATVGVRLLQLNYDLPDRAWGSLLAFGGIKEMLVFTAEVSATLADACARLPLLMAPGLKHPDVALLN